jgi:hypothetical protein
MDEVIILRRCTGLNTVVDPVDLPFSPEHGIGDLAETLNVSLAPSGRPGRSDGYTKLQDLTNGHSGFCNGGDAFIAQGTSLYQLGTDNSLTVIRSGLSGHRIAYLQRGDRTYYSNGIQNGMIYQGISAPWGIDSYNGPDTNIKWCGAVPVFSHMTQLSGRLYGAYKNMVMWSEPHKFGLFTFKHIKMFSSSIKMIKAVASGIFVSDLKRQYFLSGLDPHKMELKRVADYPAYEWSDAIDYVEGIEIGLNEPGLCALWSSPEGACLGTSSGQLININKEKIIYPENGSTGASLLRGYHFIHTIR